MAPKMNLVAAALALPAVSMAAALPGDTTAQVVGGSPAAAGEFPYIVSLSSSGSHFCGGVLVDANTVLTAGHCSDKSASAVKVRAGSLKHASGGKQVGVSKITVHPEYDEQTVDNDIAVWKLASPIQAGDDIAYAVLPKAGSDPSAGSTVTVAGWGLTTEAGSSIPASLLKVSVPVVSRDKCRSQYGQSAITDSMFCAGYAEGGKDACSGDSGGPIVDESNTLVGLVSWGQGCAKAGYSGVYARVGSLLSWVQSNI